MNQSQIARSTGISRTTIRSWLEGRTSRERAGDGCMRCHGTRRPFQMLTWHAYAYLLGLYLSDGFISRHRRGVYRLQICQFIGYPRLIAECAAAVSLVMPHNRVSVRQRQGERAVSVQQPIRRHQGHLL